MIRLYVESAQINLQATLVRHINYLTQVDLLHLAGTNLCFTWTYLACTGLVLRLMHHQLILGFLLSVTVAATEYGKVYGIDSSNGEIVWSKCGGAGKYCASQEARFISILLPDFIRFKSCVLLAGEPIVEPEVDPSKFLERRRLADKAGRTLSLGRVDVDEDDVDHALSQITGKGVVESSNR